MKINRLYPFSLLLVTILFISSCATNRGVEKLLIGKWNPVTVENVSPDASQLQEMQTIKVDTSTDPDTRKEIELTLPATPSQKESRIERAMATEKISHVMLSDSNNHKVVVKYYPGKTAKGSWKLTKKGTRIKVKMNETSRTASMDILSLTDSTAVLYEKLPYAEFRVKYVKEK